MSLPGKLRDRCLRIRTCEPNERIGQWAMRGKVVAMLWLMCCPKGLEE